MKIFGASSFAAYLYGILMAFALLAAPAAGATTTNPLLGTWQNISYEQSGGKYWTDTTIINSDNTFSGTDVASDGSGSCKLSGIYSYTSTTITITITSSAITGNAGCTPVGTITFAYTISGSGIGSKFILEDGYTYTKISEPSAAIPASANSLIGTWSFLVTDEVTLAFDDNGNYTLNQIAVSGTPQFTVQQLQVWPGIETGAYSWNAATGALVTACPTVDNNGTAGVSQIAPGGYTGYGGTPIGSACPYSTMTSTLTVNGNTATWLNEGGTFTLTRITPATPPATLTVTLSGSGNGAVTSDTGGINCGATCNATYTSGISVTLTATPADNNTYFYGWSGACSGTGSCVVTMNTAKDVTATFKPVPFVATTQSTITPTSATISTTVSFAPADVGKTGAVYITAWAPASGLTALGLAAPISHALSVTTTRDNPYTGGKINTRQETLAAVLAAADPNAFVLVQLTSTGWQLVQNGQLIPYASGVLGDALSSLSILNNANPSNLLGAQFCVGYGTSAAEMVASGRMMPVADIPGSTVATNGSCNVAANPYKGLWYNRNESGWGMSVTQHDSINFVALYTYDPSAQPVWYVMSNCPIVAAGSCTGDIYKVTGGSVPTSTWAPSLAVVTAGSGTLTFSDANNGKFDFTLNGVAGSKTIERQLFSSGTAAQALDYTDLWWNANESGWGVALTQDMGMLFAAWYTYDAAGLPVWYVASSCPLSGSGCTGDVYKVTGGSMPTSPWAPTLAVNKVGTVSFSFSDSGTGTMSYTIGGVAGSKAISRQAF